MYWANFLHIYQPPTQTQAIVRKVTEECYRTLVRVLEEAPRAKITLNINAVLAEQLDRYGFKDVIEGLKGLAERGQFKPDGSLFLVYLSLYSLWRVSSDFLREGTPFLFGLHQAQVLAVIVLAIVVSLLAYRTHWVPRESMTNSEIR